MNTFHFPISEILKCIECKLDNINLSSMALRYNKFTFFLSYLC